MTGRALYVETSAVLVWLLGQPGAEAVRSSLDGADTVVTSSLTFAETERCLIRSEKDGLVRPADAQRLRGLLARAGSSWVRMGVGEEVLAKASRQFPIEPLRTLDAIHLATALEFTKAFPDLRLLSLDRRILENACSLGLD